MDRYGIEFNRRKLGWTQTDLANAVGVTQATISQIETGVKTLSKGMTLKIEAALGCTLDVSQMELLIQKLHELSPRLLNCVDIIVTQLLEKSKVVDKTDEKET